MSWRFACSGAIIAADAPCRQWPKVQWRAGAAKTTLSNFTRDPDMQWFREHVGSARAVLISPQIVQAGFIVGGSGGAGTGAPVTADMIVYTRSKGLYGGIDMDGTVITVDEGRNQAYYGQAATPVDILVTRSVSNPYGAPLAQAVNSAVSQSR